MRKKILIGCLLLSCGAYSQVGVNVPLPLAAFHVDGSKNNTLGVAPSVDEAKDDFVITKEGKVGLGTYTPEATLDINGKLRMVDGNQGANKVMMSDGTGTLKWESIPYITPTIVGSFETRNMVRFRGTETSNTYTYSLGFIELPKGLWIVNAGLTLDVLHDKWMHAVLSTSKTTKEQNGFQFTGPANKNTAYATRVLAKNPNDLYNFNLLSGSSLVEVTSNTKVKIYLLIENVNSWDFNPSSLENFFYAIPVITK